MNNTPGRERDASRYTVEASLKTLEVLLAFGSTTKPLTIAEAATQARVGRSQAYRSLKTLEATGLVASGDAGYFLTPKILTLLPAVQGQSLLTASEPVLQRLRDETGETVNLITRVSDRELVCLATYPTPHAIGLLTKVGQRSELHAGAVSKAVLAWLPMEEQEALLAHLPHLRRYTADTVMDADRLRCDLSLTRNRGYSISDQDFEAGASGVGAPIFGPNGAPLGGLSVGGPVSRVDGVRLVELGIAARRAAEEISARMGHRVAVGSGPQGSGSQE